MSDDKRSPKDLVLVHASTEDGKGVHVLRSRGNRVEAGVMRSLEHGRPIQGEVVKLKQRPEFPLLFDAETQVTADGKAAGDSPKASDGKAASGPAQVASDSYRKNYDAIWKRRSKKPNALPN